MPEFLQKIIDVVKEIWSIPLVQALVYLILAFVAAGIASFVVKKLCKFLKLDAKLDKWGINEGQVGTSIKFIGKIVFLITFLLFLPAVFNSLGLEGVSAPITEFVSKCLNYVPNVIAALLITFIGIFIGSIIGEIVSILLAKTRIDNLSRKLGTDTIAVKFSSIIGNVVYAIIVMIVIVQALVVLNLEAISTPALSIINSVFSAIPNILLASVVIGFGIIVINIACNLLLNLLVSTNFDGLIEKIAPGKNSKISLTKITVTTVRVILMVFIVAEGIEILGLSILSGILTAVIAYVPMIIKSVIIAAIAFVGATALDSFIKKTMPTAKTLPMLAKALIYVIAGFMILSQLDFATMIVNSAFVITLCALAVAFAIAFGLGGKDFAKKTLDKIDSQKEENKDDKAE